MVGIGRAVRSGRRDTVISACIAGIMLSALLIGFTLVPSNGLNLAGNTSSPPSMVGLWTH
jgi:hypothetical protein